MMQLKGFLYEMNPLIKLIILIIFAITVTFSQDIFYPLLILLTTILSGIVSGIPFSYFWKKMKLVALGVSLICVFILFTRLSKETSDINLIIGYISYSNLEQALSLALRMLGFVYSGFLFSETTDPVILVLSLIKFWKLPIAAGYAFLSAYRFVPTFSSELNKIKLAHESRNYSQSFLFRNALVSLPKYLFPLIIQAIRTGERVSIAMEARSFGLNKTKTYYKEVAISKKDYRLILFTIVYVFCLLVILSKLNLLKVNVGF